MTPEQEAAALEGLAGNPIAQAYAAGFAAATCDNEEHQVAANRIADLERELKFLRMTERMAHQHAVRADATVAELEARLAQREAEIAHMKAQRWGATAETVDRMVKAENERDALQDRVGRAIARGREECTSTRQLYVVCDMLRCLTDDDDR